MPLVCSGLGFRYGGAEGAPLLDGLSLSIEPGEFVGVAGRSGTGKTTLLRLFAAREVPTEGTLSLDGLASDGAPETKRAFAERVGLVQQLPERQLFAKTVWEDVAFGPRRRGLSDEEVDARVEEALAAVDLDLERARETSPFAVSGGEQRRAALAGVLALRPDYLLLDEPTAGLDPEQRDALMALLERLADEGCAVVLVSHDAELLAAHAQRLLLIGGGGLLYDGPTKRAVADVALMEAAGLEQPLAAAMAARLRARGLAVADDVVSAEELAAALAPRAASGEVEAS